ncbi:hypothetical protein [Micromonospora haikouensis]|uniref:hypothetical protein n=1 Tax=Micromonospora haikouensis TaxID=686309 RepID=UPI0037A91505
MARAQRRGERATGGPRRPVDLTVFDEPDRVPRHRLRADARLGGLEVLRQPQAANPPYLTVAQFAALRDHLPPR